MSNVVSFKTKPQLDLEAEKTAAPSSESAIAKVAVAPVFESQIGALETANKKKKNTPKKSTPKLKAAKRPAGYSSWSQMKQRCTNENHTGYADYGGRGITYDASWKDFEKFIADMGSPPSEKHSLDRIDPDGNYEPGNCKWSTKAEQARNRRTTTTVEYQGKTYALAELAEKFGIALATLVARLKAGMKVEEALSEPVLRGGDRRCAAPACFRV